MWGVKLEDLIPQVYLSYLQHWCYLSLTSNDLNGGIMGGQIKNSWKYTMWGIKLEDLIP